MNESRKPTSMKRRAFFGRTGVLAGALIAGAGILPSFLRPKQSPAPARTPVVVTPNHLAVPRSAKGRNTNG
jgi:hypothetical protein